MGARTAFSAAENEAIRERVRALAQRLGSQNKAAKALGISSAALSEFMNGRCGASPRFVFDLCRLDGTPFPWTGQVPPTAGAELAGVDHLRSENARLQAEVARLESVVAKMRGVLADET